MNSTGRGPRLGVVDLRLGDCLAGLASVESNSVDAMVTDPPAGIGFMGKSWDSDKGGRVGWIEWLEGVMREALRVLKPGAHGLVWALPRTSHWTATALEQSGFEVRDVITHHFGTGFPKSLDVSKAIDEAAGATREQTGVEARRPNPRAMSPMGDGTRENDSATLYDAPATDAAKQWDGWGTALKPATEHWVLVRKPLSGTVAANVQEHGTGALNIDATRIGTTKDVPASAPKDRIGQLAKGDEKGRTEDTDGFDPNVGRWPANLVLSHGSRTWYALSRDVTPEDRQAIYSYYRAQQAVLALRRSNPRDAVGVATTEVLHPGVCWTGTEGSTEKEVGQDALRSVPERFRGDASLDKEWTPKVLFSGVRGDGERIIEEDRKETHGQRAQENGGRSNREVSAGELIAVEGGEIREPGVYPRDDRDLAAGASGDSQENDIKKLRPGTQDCGSRDGKACPEEIGSGSSSQRDQDGQSTGKRDDSSSERTRDRTSDTGAGASKATPGSGQADSREFGLEVVAELIPEYLRRFFELSHSEWCAVGGCLPGCPVALLDAQSGPAQSGAMKASTIRRGTNEVYGKFTPGSSATARAIEASEGGASRFFYTSKPTTAERERDLGLHVRRAAADLVDREAGSDGLKSPRAGAGRTSRGRANIHPTVKSLDLMSWLIRLVTPPGGIVMDPFTGSGSTGVAARHLGFRFLGWEADPEYFEIAKARIASAVNGPLFAGVGSP